MVKQANEPDWTPNIGKMICAPSARVVLMFGNGKVSEPTTAGEWHWGMHRRMPGTIIAWRHA